MKTRQRPPLILSEPDSAPDGDFVLPEAGDNPSNDHIAEPERPISERERRRREREQTELVAELAEPASPPQPAAPPADPVSNVAPVLATRNARARSRSDGGRGPLILAGVASALWVGAIAAWAAYEVGATGGPINPFQLAVYVLVALAPVGLALLLAQSLRQSGRLSGETRRAREMAEALVAPTALAARNAGEVVQSLRGDIDQAALAAERARNDMTLLRQVLAEETTRLNEAAEIAQRTSRRLSEALARERESMQSLAAHLDQQSTTVVDAVERQSRMVVDASDLAQTQLREAEAALAARSADMAAAAVEAQDAARLAADDLARQTLRLENAGAGVAEQIQAVEEGLGQQRAALVTAAYALRTDQEDFSAQVESQRAQLIEQLTTVRAAADTMNATTGEGHRAVAELMEAASDQFKALVDLSAQESAALDQATRDALERFENQSAETRAALLEETRRTLDSLRVAAEQTRQMSESAANEAQARTDRMAEALFVAAQQADTAADARIEAARRVVSTTAELVDEAGVHAGERLNAMMLRMEATLNRIDTAMSDLDVRADALPQAAQERIDAVRRSVEVGLESLSAASKKAAEDTETLEAGFQERVRRNYEMLTEAVRLMGVVASEGRRPREGDPSMKAAANSSMPAAESLRHAQAGSRSEAAAGPAGLVREDQTSTDNGRDLGLRNRLRLDAVSPLQSRADAPPSMGWRDLVESTPARGQSSVGTTTPANPLEAAHVDRVTSIIHRMGIDPSALLPRARVEEAAAALLNGDAPTARLIVRRVAPAAVRSVSRRVLSDPELQTEVEHYVRSFSASLDGSEEASLAQLASDSGRAFLLLDAAIGDIE